ncbi:Wzz/FepE/Etk N-terminal domain-containing protein [Mycobacterium sp. 852002-51057_SCH5723018]|uniref:Wzz/FepE/Etk N-terminal domain-containing protein n=1 Tax=Mycobacterium sp. 852002-51057_SCH5723018 TaxID=1834094 RepID=UPI0026872504
MLALLATVRNRLLVLITSALLGAAVAGLINLLLPVVYEASARILIATPDWNDSTALADPNVGGGRMLAYGDEFTQQRMTSYARLVTTPLVTGPVVERLRLRESGEDLAKQLSGHIVPDTVVLQIKAEDASPARAASIADATARQTIEAIKDLERPHAGVVSPVQPILIEPASVPSRPLSPRTLLNIGCGAIVGFLFALTYVAAYATAREGRMQARIRSGVDLPGEPGVLGVLTAEDQLPLDEIHNDAKFLRLEVAHGLTEAGVQSLLVASPVSTPAARIVAGLLATAFADAGSSTIVVCADFNADQDNSTAGLGDLLCKPLTLDSVIQSDERRRISWISAGTPPANPTRELTGPKMRNLLIDLSGRYGHVIVVGPAVLELADAVDLASQVGASILVDPVAETTAEEIRESERLLRLAWGTHLGRVLVAGQAFSSPAAVPSSDHGHPRTMRQ